MYAQFRLSLAISFDHVRKSIENGASEASVKQTICDLLTHIEKEQNSEILLGMKGSRGEHFFISAYRLETLLTRTENVRQNACDEIMREYSMPHFDDRIALAKHVIDVKVWPLIQRLEEPQKYFLRRHRADREGVSSALFLLFSVVSSMFSFLSFVAQRTSNPCVHLEADIRHSTVSEPIDPAFLSESVGNILKRRAERLEHLYANEITELGTRGALLNAKKTEILADARAALSVYYERDHEAFNKRTEAIEKYHHNLTKDGTNTENLKDEFLARCSTLWRDVKKPFDDELQKQYTRLRDEHATARVFVPLIMPDWATYFGAESLYEVAVDVASEFMAQFDRYPHTSHDDILKAALAYLVDPNVAENDREALEGFIELLNEYGVKAFVEIRQNYRFDLSDVRRAVQLDVGQFLTEKSFPATKKAVDSVKKWQEHVRDNAYRALNVFTSTNSPTSD